MEKIDIKLTADTIIPDLNKYTVKLEMDNLNNEATPESKELLIQKSIEHQVLSKYTAFLCRIK